MSEPFAVLPGEVCFDLFELGELLNLLGWLRDLLISAKQEEGRDRVSTLIRVIQRRLWGDVQDIIDGPDGPGQE